MNVKDLLIEKLETICPDNVFLQGTIAADAVYPAKFITFWTNYTDDIAHYNNEVDSIEWNVSVNFYSTDPAEVNSKPLDIIAALKSAGFKPQGRGHDLVTDSNEHTAWTIEFLFKEKIIEEGEQENGS